MYIVHLVMSFLLTGITLGLPEAVDPNSQLVTVNYTGELDQDTEIKKFRASSLPSTFGKPLITLRGAQWPDWAYTFSEKLYNNDDVKRDTWQYTFVDIAIAGIFVPKRYKGDMNGVFHSEAYAIFNDLRKVANNQIYEVTRVGYNLDRLPSEPSIEGFASIYHIMDHVTNDTGKAMDATKPSYIIMGLVDPVIGTINGLVSDKLRRYPMSKALCYRYYGNPLPKDFSYDICANQDNLVADDLNATKTS